MDKTTSQKVNICDRCSEEEKDIPFKKYESRLVNKLDQIYCEECYEFVENFELNIITEMSKKVVEKSLSKDDLENILNPRPEDKVFIQTNNITINNFDTTDQIEKLTNETKSLKEEIEKLKKDLKKMEAIFKKIKEPNDDSLQHVETKPSKSKKTKTT